MANRDYSPQVHSMNRPQFIEWLSAHSRGVLGKREKANGFSEALASVDAFDTHLREHCGIRRIEDATPESLTSYDFDDQRNDDHHLRRLFAYIARPDLLRVTNDVSARKYFRRKTLGAIFKDMPEHKAQSAKLRRAGIRMAAELLERGADPAGRQQIAKACGLSLHSVLELVHCCDLCRMTGMAGQALRRSVEMGYTTLARFRESDPDEIRGALRTYLAAHHEKSNTMIDFADFVHEAKRLPNVVRY